MNCPFCQSSQITVVNSRPTKGSSQIWRRRKCLSCQTAFTTYEKIDLSYLKVLKRSGKKTYYNRAKFYSGIYHAAVAGKHVDRGDASIIAENITNQVEQKIIKLGKREISTAKILEMAIMALKPLHMDILLRYLAYFRGQDKPILKKLTSELT